MCQDLGRSFSVQRTTTALTVDLRRSDQQKKFKENANIIVQIRSSLMIALQSSMEKYLASTHPSSSLLRC